MAHFVYAIVAANDVADRIHEDWPQLKRYDAGDSHSIFPVDREMIDQRLESDDAPPQESETFIYLTDEFQNMLQDLSRHGKLCYLETEYFGGDGGQGACVYEHGNELMPPTWAESNTINDALATLGVESTDEYDAFDAVGLGAVRKNADFERNLIDG
jgi:hypothetical protein